jgi:predicted transcriptional regulator of viral defense system
MTKVSKTNREKLTVARARDLFARHRGYLRTAQALKLGIAPATLYEMARSGIVMQEAWGLYRLVEAELPGCPDLVTIAHRVPKGVVCLISALAFHDLTTQIPHWVYIALPKDTKKPRLDSPQIDVVWLSGRAYTEGIERHDLDGTVVPVYSAAKTVADCFRFRRKVGTDVAIEALKEYLRKTRGDVCELLAFAQINRVNRIMQPYLESLV